MKRRKSGYQKEKMIMVASSVLVMAAMTVTGVYIYRNGQAQEPEDNVVDFSVLEDDAADGQVAQAENSTARNLTSGQRAEGELDYDPYYIEQERLLNGQAQGADTQAAARDAGTAEEAADMQDELLPEAVSDPPEAVDSLDPLTDGSVSGGMVNNVGYAMIERSGVPGVGTTDGPEAGEAEEWVMDAPDDNGGQEADAAGDGQTSDTPAGSDGQGSDVPDGDGGQEAAGLTADSGQVPDETSGNDGQGTGGTGQTAESMTAEGTAGTSGTVSASAAPVSDMEAGAEEEALEAVADVMREALNLHFSESDDLAWPIAGNILLNYSMDKTIYFPTLRQYKYNPSVVIASTQGTNVTCAADGMVKEVYEDAQTGNTVVTSLGDGYELTYGQLANVTVEEGDFVEEGVVLGQVAAPTKYYSVEGTNVYIKLTKDGEPVNPLDYLG